MMEDAKDRAGRLPLVGSELAFDFTNTSSGRGGPMHREHLLTAANVIAWSRHAEVLTQSEADHLAQASATDEAFAAEMMRRTLELRDVVYAIGVAVAHGVSPGAEPVDSLARIHAQCVARARLVLQRDNYVWTWHPDSAAIETLLGPIILSALTLLTGTDFSRIKQCQGDHCGWLFVDTTKNKRRRWCEMDVCGNRAKQKRLQARRKALSR